MAIQTATTGQLANAQRIAIAEARYTEEHNHPMRNLIEHMGLKKGEKQLTVPKVGQMTAEDLTDGVDMIDTEDIGMTTTDLTTGEVGLKTILTDVLLEQQNEDVFRMVGRQMGDAGGRKVDRDIIALLAALNGGTDLGADNATMGAANTAACIAFARAQKFPSPWSIVHHPNAVFDLTQSLSITPGVSNPIPHGYAEDLLRDFHAINIGGVPVFHDGEIDVVTGTASGRGAIFSKNAMVMLNSKMWDTERERDASLRAWELVHTARYGVFELDDGYGAPMRYEIGAPTTSA